MTLGLHSLNKNITLGLSHYELMTLGLNFLNLDKTLKLPSLRDYDP